MISSVFSKGLAENTYFVRGDEEDDNPYVVEAIKNACSTLTLPIRHHLTGMKRTKDALRTNTKNVGEKIKSLGEALSKAETSEEKVNIIGEIALVVSQDCGGISFMSNELHEEIGGAGMIKKTSAVINLVVTEEYAKENPIPFLTEKELQEYVAITKETVKEIAKKVEAATNHII